MEKIEKTNVLPPVTQSPKKQEITNTIWEDLDKLTGPNLTRHYLPKEPLPVRTPRGDAVLKTAEHKVQERNNMLSDTNFSNLVKEHYEKLSDEDKNHIIEINNKIQQLRSNMQWKTDQLTLTNWESLTLREIINAYDLRSVYRASRQSMCTQKTDEEPDIWDYRRAISDAEDYQDTLEDITILIKERNNIIEKHIPGTLSNIFANYPKLCRLCRIKKEVQSIKNKISY